MELTRGTWGDVPMIVVKGAIEGEACRPLESALDGLTERRQNIVFLDLTDATSMDGAGLSVLVAWVQGLGGRGWLGVIAANDHIRRVMDGEALLSHPNVRVFEDRHQALIVTGERQST